MISKPTSGDSEQRSHESERARKSSALSASGSNKIEDLKRKNEESHGSSRPMHGSSEGESAHGAIPRRGIEFEQGD
jgi:hypothetical protein